MVRRPVRPRTRPRPIRCWRMHCTATGVCWASWARPTARSGRSSAKSRSADGWATASGSVQPSTTSATGTSSWAGTTTASASSPKRSSSCAAPVPTGSAWRWARWHQGDSTRASFELAERDYAESLAEARRRRPRPLDRGRDVRARSELARAGTAGCRQTAPDRGPRALRGADDRSRRRRLHHPARCHRTRSRRPAGRRAASAVSPDRDRHPLVRRRRLLDAAVRRIGDLRRRDRCGARRRAS